MGGEGSGRKPIFNDARHIRMRESQRTLRRLKKHPSLYFKVKNLDSKEATSKPVKPDPVGPSQTIYVFPNRNDKYTHETTVGENKLEN